MRYPSVKTILQIPNIDKATAKKIRAIMEGPSYVDGDTRMERIDTALGNYGIERIERGRGSKSPAFDYSNNGDSYTATVVKVNGQFRISSWGDIVERGNYE